MISGNNNIDVLDIYKEEKLNIIVSDIINKCGLSNKSIYVEENIDGLKRVIDCPIDKDRKLYLRDLNGWTLLTRIEKFEMNNQLFILNNEIRVFDNENIPLYSRERYNVGFHGTLLYKYDVINISDIKYEAYVRNGLNDFIPLLVKKTKDNELYGYRITTNVGMYSIGPSNIQLFGGINKKNRYY